MHPWWGELGLDLYHAGKTHPYFYVDNDSVPELSYFMSICFNYLPFRYKFHSSLSHIVHIASVWILLEYPWYHEEWHSQCLFGQRIWILADSYDESWATFPSITPNVGKFFGIDYQTWWKKTRENFLDNHLQTLVNVVGPIVVACLEGSNEVCKGWSP